MLNNAQFCCNDMEYNVTESNIISYSSKFDEYGIVIPDDGVSYMLLSYCPYHYSKTVHYLTLIFLPFTAGFAQSPVLGSNAPRWFPLASKTSISL